jgi:AraC family transcriptional regulator
VQLLSGHFYGTTVRTTTFAGFVLADTAYGPGMRIARHMHERSYISFLLRGSYTERYANHTRSCELGTLLVHPAGESHTNQFDEDGGRVLSLEIPLGYCDSDPRCLATDDAVEVYQLANLMSRLGRELTFGDDSSITIEAVAFELAGILERAFAPEQLLPRWLREAVALLHERFCEPLSLQQIAAAIGVHPVHLARTFRAARHCTVGDYLRYLRVAFARRKLAESSMPIAEIAHRSGFSDQSHLDRVFKRQMGMTPSQFRSTIE